MRFPVEEKSVGLDDLVFQVGKDWVEGGYYDEAEKVIEDRWPIEVWPYIEEADFRHVLDLAAGHGRNSARLAAHADRVTVMDYNLENINFCKRRFGDDPKFTYIKNSGFAYDEVENASVSLVFCYDAMVHFDSDVVRAYVRDTGRVLVPGGRAFFHYSNYTRNPRGDVHDNPGWRNFMSLELFEHYATKEGLEVVLSDLIRYSHDLGAFSDAVSVLAK